MTVSPEGSPFPQDFVVRVGDETELRTLRDFSNRQQLPLRPLVEVQVLVDEEQTVATAPLTYDHFTDLGERRGLSYGAVQIAWNAMNEWQRPADRRTSAPPRLGTVTDVVTSKKPDYKIDVRHEKIVPARVSSVLRKLDLTPETSPRGVCGQAANLLAAAGGQDWPAPVPPDDLGHPKEAVKGLWEEANPYIDPTLFGRGWSVLQQMALSQLGYAPSRQIASLIEATRTMNSPTFDRVVPISDKAQRLQRTHALDGLVSDAALRAITQAEIPEYVRSVARAAASR